MPKKNDSRRRKAPLARYANYFEVSHNAFEFLIDFGQFQPEAGSVQLHTRMATGPTHAKLLVEVLRNAVAQFEAEHGEIAGLLEADDPLELIHASLPDFEKRAAQAREVAQRRAVAPARGDAPHILGPINRPDSSQKG